MTKPLVSVIVPVYNVQNYIERCIKSILDQSYKNIELILIDDGSTDNSKNICEQFTMKDKRVCLISKKNEGAGYARNVGIDLAKGKYIMFVDSDDYLLEYGIERAVSVIIKENADIVRFGHCSGKDNNYSINTRIKPYKVYDNKQVFRTRETDICVWGKLYKRSILGNIRYPKVSTYDDEFVTYKFLYQAKKIVLLNEIYYYYYMSSNSIMRSRDKELPLGIVNAYEERKLYFKDKKEDELYEITCKEYAIRLMLLYFKYDLYRQAKYSKDELYAMFKREYKQGRNVTSGIKEKITLLGFNIAPKIMDIAVKIIKRQRYL